MGLSISTVLEVFTNPDDLIFDIGNPESEKGYCFRVARGPDQSFKILFSTLPMFESRDEAILALGSVLTSIIENAKETLSDPESLLGSLFNPGREPIIEKNVLNPKLTARILELLKKGELVKTYEDFPVD